MIPISENLAGAVLTIDLKALQDNWRILAKRVGRAECGAAVKGNAYGLGMAPAARALWQAGCRSYFVAKATEGSELRSLLSEADIYVLDGLAAGQAELYAKLNLIPALVSSGEAREWAAYGRAQGRPLDCVLHVDTGINRLGFSMQEFVSLVDDSITMQGLNPTLLMSHLACADEPAHPLNLKQRDAFAQARKKLPRVRASFANSSGIFLGTDYIHDLARPGIALYGGNPTPGGANPMAPVVHLEAAVMQIREVQKGETVGYGATWKAPRPSRIAVLGAGYGDGIPRSLSSTQTDGPAQVFIGGQPCPIIGRVSMDMMAIDVTGLPSPSVVRGTRAEIFGKHISVDEAAFWAGTISYELLTRLGSRYARLYSGGDSDER
ncbi:MAG TPA: alanine racemase [Aestuariivirga sp.]|nr:alanine racemase [Aestuariivirga sp.]